MKTNKKDDAKATIETAKDKVQRDERSLFLALAYSQVGEREKAAAAFESAVAERPEHLPTLQAHAEFLFQSGKLADARQAFEKVINLKSASPKDREFAQYMIAVAFAGEPDYEKSRLALEALKLIVPKGATESPAQKRKRALVLATQKDRDSKVQAIRLLEEDRSILTANDRFLLAQLHLAVGNRPQVRVAMTDLLRRPEAAKVPIYLAFFAAWLLQEKDLSEAATWIEKLKSVQPDGLETVILEARLLAAKKELPKARALLLKKAETEKAGVGLLGRTCEEIGLFDEAEQLLKRFIAENRDKRPELPLALAEFYGRRNRLQDAIQICESVPAVVPSRLVGEVAVNALYLAPNPSSMEIQRVADWLNAAAAKAQAGDRAILLQHLATLNNLKLDYAASMEQYRSAIAANPKNALALNNLAFLLSMKEGKHDEALRLIEQARRAIGPNPDVLDTEAIIRLNRGELDIARSLMKEVIAVAPSGTAYFHLTQVELAAKRELDAQIAWRRASEDLKLKVTDLHPLEREGFQEVLKKMSGKN